MAADLVKNAYERMLEEHGDELKHNASVYIHSDQGSQYLSTTFKELLEDDGFVQSVSARGNSQDNAPMESFFGRLKTAILDMVARCRTFDDAKNLISGYINAYNTEHYQYDLAALTPAEFYQYATTGIYPLDSYFGVPASVMMTNGDLKKVHRRYADDEAERRREAAERKREGRRLIDPLRIIRRDQNLLDRLICKWEESKETAAIQISRLKEIVEKIKKAHEFIVALPAEKYEELKDPLSWRKHEQLGYVFEMNELF